MATALFTAGLAAAALALMAAVPDLRTRRYVGFAALLVAVWAACGWLPGTTAVVARIACVIVFSVGIFPTDWLGLASLTPGDRLVGDRVDEALRLGRGADPSDRASALAIVEGLLEQGAPPAWLPGLRTLRWAWRTGPGFPDPTGTRPADYERAAIHYLRDARNAGRLGTRQSVARDDESLALRAYMNEVRAALGGRPADPSAGRSDALEVLAEMRALRIVDPWAEVVRGLVVELLELELGPAATPVPMDDGEREQYDRLSERLDAAWKALDAHPATPPHGARR